jgi:predicted CoA-substrate-specific enzyme activase
MNGFVCGCDVGSTFGKAVVMDMDGTICGHAIVRSKIDPEETSALAISEAFSHVGGTALQSELLYVVGTGYGRARISSADENISEITCHAMGVHVAAPSVRTIIDIGGQDIKGISLDESGSVKNFAMNDKCAAGTGRFFENMARVFEMDLTSFSELSLRATCPCAISSQCGIFAETEVISLFSKKKDPADVAAGIQVSVAKRCITLLKSAGIQQDITMTGGCAKNRGLRKRLEDLMGFELVELPIDPQLMGAIGASELARRRAAKEAGQASA